MLEETDETGKNFSCYSPQCIWL